MLRALPRRLARPLFARFMSTSPAPGFFELRTDQVLPGQLDVYLQEQERVATARAAALPGWLGMWKTELGGPIHTVRHLYRWADYDERDQARSCAEAQSLPLLSLRQKLAASESVVMVEATAGLQACGLKGAVGFTSPAGTDAAAVAWELRTYQLQLGYETVPKFLELYTDGLKDKLAADDSGASQLATLLYSDCGSLNVVMELWRHESLERSQVGKRQEAVGSRYRPVGSSSCQAVPWLACQPTLPRAASPPLALWMLTSHLPTCLRPRGEPHARRRDGDLPSTRSRSSPFRLTLNSCARSPPPPGVDRKAVVRPTGGSVLVERDPSPRVAVAVDVAS